MLKCFKNLDENEWICSFKWAPVTDVSVAVMFIIKWTYIVNQSDISVIM